MKASFYAIFLFSFFLMSSQLHSEVRSALEVIRPAKPLAIDNATQKPLKAKKVSPSKPATVSQKKVTTKKALPTVIKKSPNPAFPKKAKPVSKKKPLKKITKTKVRKPLKKTQAVAAYTNQTAPVPVQIQQYLRSAYSMQNQEVHGHLRSDRGMKIPFRLSMKNKEVRYDFANPRQRISLNLRDNGSQLKERTEAKGTRPVPAQRYHEKVRGTEINYEDLGMRFLYWERPGLLGTERIKFQKTWKLRVFNPNTLGPYRYVDVWVEQKSGAIMKMRGFDMKTGEMIKEFKVVSVQKVNGGYILKEMRIESYDPGNTFPAARSYLSLNNPQAL